MRRERFDKSARIPVRVRNGRVEFLYDVELPPLSEGTIGELVVDVNSVQDPKWERFLVEESSIEIAPEGAYVAFKMAVDKGATAHEDQLISFREYLELMEARPVKEGGTEGLACFGDGVGVLGQLTEPLRLRLRGENLSKLRGGVVEIPALQELNLPHKAPTLNQAFVMVSQTFEPDRAGHNGDAFRDIYLLKNHKWILLDDIRAQFEAENEVERWERIGLDPQKVQQRIYGGLFADTPTRKELKE